MVRHEIITYAILLTIIALLALAACQEVPINSCLPITEFSPAIQHKMNIALQHLPKGSPLELIITDWIKMRDEARACSSQNG